MASVTRKSGCIYRANTASDAVITPVQMIVLPSIGRNISGPCWLLARTRPMYGRFPDGQIDQAGKDAKRNGDVPDDVITARSVIQDTSQPHTHERADLMAEKNKPAQHGQMRHAENLGYCGIGRRHG